MSEFSHPAGESRPVPEEADWQRLAAGLAMLAGEPGEAANAGRAAGVMARRLGLTGGDLKRIFLAGLAAIEAGGAGAEDLHERLAWFRAEALEAGRERDRLRGEAGRLGTELNRLRGRIRLGGAMATGALAVLVLLAGGLWLARPAAPLIRLSAAAPSAAKNVSPAPGTRLAVVRPGGATLFPAPQSGPASTRLAPGQSVVVRRLIWNALFQWAEVEVPGGASGYLLTTELDLS